MEHIELKPDAALALMVIGEIRGKVATMGANDHELDALKGLEAKLENGELEPEEAIKQANELVSSKQDYH